MTSKTQTEQYLRSVELPEETKSYTVISHGDIIDKLRDLLEKNNFVVETELFKAEAKGEIALGFIKIKNDLDPDMGMTFNWSNSYNKQLRFSCSIGGFIYDNKVPFVSANNSAIWTRKHTGVALDETLETMEAMITIANEHFNEIVEMKKKFQTFKVSRKDYAKLIGLLYFDKHIISADQASIIRREYDKPSFEYSDSTNLWGLYKIIMHAVSDQAPKSWYQQQVKINNYVQLMYKMIKAEDEDTEELEIEDEVTIPEQTTLELSTSEEVVTMSEEQIEMVEREYAYATTSVNDTPETAVSFFDTIDKKSTLESHSLMIVDFSDNPEPAVVVNEKGVFEETATCENCGSTDVIINASAQMICDNCGHEEDTGLGENTFEEEDDFEIIDDSDDLDVTIFEEENEEEIIEEEEITLPTVETSKEKPILKLIEIEPQNDDLFSLDEEVTPIRTLPAVKILNKAIVDFASNYYSDSELESANIIENNNYTVVELNTNELFVLNEIL